MFGLSDHRPVRGAAGFTLVELMIVVAIVAILAAVAYPSYRNFVLRSHRADGTTTLLRIAQNLERYYAAHNTYAGATLGANQPTDVWGSKLSPDGFYTLSLDPPPSQTQYTVRANARGEQAKDTACAVLTLDQAGLKNPPECWK